MFKRNTKSTKAGFTISVDEGTDIKFTLGDQSFYLMDILEELNKKINTSVLVIFISVAVSILIAMSITIPKELANLSYQTIQQQSIKITLQDSKLKEQDKVILELRLNVNTLQEQIKHKVDK